MRMNADPERFAALYSPGMGPMPSTVASEAFPLSHRETGVAVSVGVNLFVAGLLTVFYPRLNSALGNTGSLGLFAGFNFLAATMILLWVPETKQRSLEELDFVFAVPIKTFMRYQVKEVLPWFLEHYFLGSHAQLEDLYKDRIWSITNGKNNPNNNPPMQTPAHHGSEPEHQQICGGVPQNDNSELNLDPHEDMQERHGLEDNQRDTEVASISSSVPTHE